jgi:hypothetical protein
VMYVICLAYCRVLWPTSSRGYALERLESDAQQSDFLTHHTAGLRTFCFVLCFVSNQRSITKYHMHHISLYATLATMFVRGIRLRRLDSTCLRQRLTDSPRIHDSSFRQETQEKHIAHCF